MRFASLRGTTLRGTKQKDVIHYRRALRHCEVRSNLENKLSVLFNRNNSLALQTKHHPIMDSNNKGYVYILFNKRNGTLYTGVTSFLKRRVYEHKTKLHPDSFTAKYSVDKLGYYEEFVSIKEAIEREKQIKGGSRATKIALIESTNPYWEDLYDLL